MPPQHGDLNSREGYSGVSNLAEWHSAALKLQTDPPPETKVVSGEPKPKYVSTSYVDAPIHATDERVLK